MLLALDGLVHLRWLDRSTGRMISRITTNSPGDLVHVELKKMGKIPAGGGWREIGNRHRRPAPPRTLRPATYLASRASTN